MVSFHTDIKSNLMEANSTSGTQHTTSHIQFPAEFLLFLLSCCVRSGVSISRSCRYYFVVEEDNTPLLVTVTPCDAPLEWRLTLQELPEDRSGEGSGIRIKSPDQCCNSAVI